MNWRRFVPELVLRRLAGRTKVQASLFYASSSLICQGMRFCGIVISTRLIDAPQFGYFAQASLVLMAGDLLRELGQSTALISYTGVDRRYASYHFQLSVVLGLLAAFGIWCLFPILTAIPPHARWSVWILILIAGFQSLTQTGVIVAQKAFRFGLLARIEVVAVGVWLVALIGFTDRCEGFIALLLAQLIEHATRLAAVMIACGWRSIGWAAGKDLRGYYFGRFARHLLPRTILQALAGRIDYLLLNFLSTVTQLGIYERMLQFIRIPWSLSINLVDRVLLVSYSKEQNDPAALRKTLGKSFQFILVAAAGAIGSATLFFLLFLSRLVGSDWAPVILHHWWIALPFTVVIPFVWNLNIFLEGTGQARQLLLNTILALATGTLVGVLLVPRYGAAGMLVTQGVVHVALLAYQIVILRKRQLPKHAHPSGI